MTVATLPFFMSENHNWETQPDGSRVKRVNGIRIVNRSATRPTESIEHLVAHRESGGALVVIGLNAACQPVYQATL